MKSIRVYLMVTLLAGFTASFLYAEPEESKPIASYLLGPKDLIEVKVFEVPELNVERRVDADGTIELPLVGKIAVEGLTSSKAAEIIKERLESTYVQRASVTVQVREYRSRPITVLGAVRQPGPLAYTGNWTLLDALAAAGGVQDGAVGDKIYILRRAQNGLTDQIFVSVDDLILRADPDANLPLYPNDLINVPARANVTVYCLGEFRSPGALTFTSTDRITVMTAIARAGGLTDRAASTVLIKRRDRSGKDIEIKVNAKRVLAGKDPDLELQTGDVLIVKESFF